MELLVASALGLVVLTAFVLTFRQHRSVYDQKNLEQEMQFNVRNALSFLEEDLVLAGSGLVMGIDKAPDWFTELSGATTMPHIVDGGTGPDQVWIAGMSGVPVATLDDEVDAGDQILELDPFSQGLAEYRPQVGDVLLLAGVEAVRVTAVSTWSEELRVTVQADAFDTTAGVQLDYPEDAEVYLLGVVEYRIAEQGGVPGLVRDDSRYQYESEEDKRVAENITDLQFSRVEDRIQVTVRGRSREKVPTLSDSEGYLRYTLSEEVQLRVPDPRLRIGHWPRDALTATPTPALPTMP
jgi:hypothetical protein